MIHSKIAARPCVHCGKVFTPIRRDRKGECCSVRCHVEHKIVKHGQQRRVGEHTKVWWCADCGVLVHKDQSWKGRCERCVACQRAYDLSKARGYYQDHYKSRVWDTGWCQCRECGKVWWAFERASLRKYCSETCMNKQVKVYNHRKRARKYGVTYERIKLSELMVRDGSRCQLCGRKVRRTRTHTKLRATIGHIVAMSRGGSHTWDNVQLECVMCNSNKGVRTYGQRRLLAAPQ